MKMKMLVASTLLFGALTLASCASSATTTTTSAGTTHTTTHNDAVKNLVVTPAVRKGLFDAAAKYHQLPTKDYVGLAKHTTYYAFDPKTNRYYAAAGLIPSPHSLKAQIGTQDDGGYNLFTRLSTSPTWTVFNDGMGASEDAICPLRIPAAVLVVWNWTAKSCYPPLAS